MKNYRGFGVALLLASSVGTPAMAVAQAAQDSGKRSASAVDEVPGLHDFDFLIGQWRSHHRKLKQRLTHSRDWLEFDGTLVMHTLMGGYANVDDNTFAISGAPYSGVGLRSFDAKTRQWSIWWLDSRTPMDPLDPPVRGTFHDGVGTFYAEDKWKGTPVRVRFEWSRITANSCHWEQAYSTDGGKTWEINWVMDFTRE